MIEVKNLSKIYNKGKQNEVRACDDISIKLEDTGLYVIFGKSGAGKSSFMNALGGLDKYTSGTIAFDDQEFKKNVSDKCRIQNIGYIFQNYCLEADLNVYDNVALGLKSIGIRDEEIIFNRTMTALANVGMSKFFRRNVTTLSGGQQQRVAIARAMAKGSKIILADEPTGNLDVQNTRTVMNILKELSKTRMVIVVTHEIDIVETYADKIIEIHDGKIVNESSGLAKDYVSEDRNKIFLNELSKEQVELGGITVERYGDDIPVNITVVNKDGKIYLKADNANLKIIDKDSEIELIKSTRDEYKKEMKEDLGVKLKNLEPIEPKSSGKVFKFKDCVIDKDKQSKKTKRRNKFLKTALSLLVITVIFISASWGASYNNIKILGHYRLSPSVNLLIKNYDEFASIQNELENNPSVKDYELFTTDDNGSWGGFYGPDSKPVLSRHKFNLELANFISNVGGSNKPNASDIAAHVKRKAEVENCAYGAKTTSLSEVLISTGYLKSNIEKIRENERHYKINEVEYYNNVLGGKLSTGNTNFRVSGVVENDESIVYIADEPFYNLMLNRDNNIEENIKIAYPGEKMYLRIEQNGETITREEEILPDTIYINTARKQGTFENKDVALNINGENKILHVYYYVNYENNESRIVLQSTIDTFKQYLLLSFDNNVSYNYDAIGLSILINSEDGVSGVNSIVQRIVDEQDESSNIKMLATSEEERSYQTMYDQKQLDIMNIINLVMYGLILLISLLITIANFVERKKEVGIYRSIGVSKKNVIFKYFAENLRMVISYVLLIILLIGGLLTINSYFPINAENPAFNGSVFYLAWWQLVGIIAIIIPSLMLISIIPPAKYVRKSPIAILAEYDM